jgi:hypothetical protein
VITTCNHSGGNVLPAPYITVQQTISLVLESKTTLAAHLPSLDEVQCNELRLLGYYFPARMNLLLRDDDIQTILMNGYIRFVVFFGVMGVGVWQVRGGEGLLTNNQCSDDFNSDGSLMTDD